MILNTIHITSALLDLPIITTSLIILLFNLTYVKYLKLKYNLFASVRRFILLAYVAARTPMIEITGVLAKGINTINIYYFKSFLASKALCIIVINIIKENIFVTKFNFIDDSKIINEKQINPSDLSASPAWYLKDFIPLF